MGTLGIGHAGVVHQDRDRSEGGLRRVDRAGDGGGVAHVERDAATAAAGRGDLGHEVVEPIEPAAAHATDAPAAASVARTGGPTRTMRRDRRASTVRSDA